MNIKGSSGTWTSKDYTGDVSADAIVSTSGSTKRHYIEHVRVDVVGEDTGAILKVSDGTTTLGRVKCENLGTYVLFASGSDCDTVALGEDSKVVVDVSGTASSIAATVFVKYHTV
jgi:hypothetical protein